MVVRFYKRSDASAWPSPEEIQSGYVTDLEGRKHSIQNLLQYWTKTQVEEAFGVLEPTWANPPAGQVVASESVTPDGSGGLTFTRIFQDRVNPTPAQLLATIQAQVKAEKVTAAYQTISAAMGDQYTLAELETRVANLTTTQRDTLAAVFGLAGADLL